MLISGFSMVKNASKLYYPMKQAIESILPIVDEFILALGDCDEDDRTREEIESIGSDKIKIIDTKWDLEKYPRGMENAHQTDIAKKECKGDWLFYLQADEVIHERYFDEIVGACKKYKEDKDVEGFLFKYKHFWGDYDHYHISHKWYPREIRIIRNDKEIHSWESAQSFRRIPDFNGLDYREKKGTYKLNVVELNSYIYHYGWVRPPHYMQSKKQALDTVHKGKINTDRIYENAPKEFDYGPLNNLEIFTETHPAIMKEWIEKFDWKDKLQYNGRPNLHRKKHKHETVKYRFITFLEQKLLNGKRIGGFKNYILLRK